MGIQVQKYVRNPFRVDAVAVTPENIAEVAVWCGGEVRDSDLSKDGGREGFQQYIKVPVKRPLNDRQSRAYYDDWVLLTTSSGADTGPAGFKVYTPKAFEASFSKQVDHMMEVIARMDQRAADEIRAEQEEIDFEDLPGTRQTVLADPIGM